MPILQKIQRPQPTANPLTRFARNVHSQCGEDGIIQEILRKVAPGTRTRPSARATHWRR